MANVQLANVAQNTDTPGSPTDSTSTLPVYKEIDGLPSNFFYYDFKTLGIRNVLWKDLQKIYSARHNGDVHALLNAIDGLIDRDLNEITFGDFEYIVYTIRVNNYTTPIVFSWTCDCGQQNADTMSGNPETNAITQYVELPEHVDIPRMRNYLEFMDFDKEHPDQKELLDIVMWVEGNSLADKLELMEKATDLTLFEDARNTAMTLGSHGVISLIDSRCIKCKKEVRVSLDVPLFELLV